MFTFLTHHPPNFITSLIIKNTHFFSTMRTEEDTLKGPAFDELCSHLDTFIALPAN